MTRPYNQWRSSVLGAVNGFIFGGIAEVASLIRFEYLQRELERIAAEDGAIICVSYGHKWFAYPVIFTLAFTLVSYLVHKLARNLSSVVLMWQVVGVAVASLCILAMAAHIWWNERPFTSEITGAWFFMFVSSFAVGSVFGGFVRMVGTYHARSSR